MFLDRKVVREDILAAYELILGRQAQAEDEAIFSGWVGEMSLRDLRDGFLRSDEFISIYSRLAGAEIRQALRCRMLGDDMYEPPQVQWRASEEQLEKLLKHSEEVWSSYGEDEAYWSVRTLPQYAGRNLTKEILDEFYFSGEMSVKKLELALRRCNEWENVQQKRCLDFGCGVGRMTVHLSRIFSTVTGMDISRGHLKLAAEIMRKSQISNVELRKVSKLEDLKTSGSFDLIYSLIVLQHNPPPVIARVIDTFFKILNPGGVAVFQVPVRQSNYTFVIDDYLERMNEINEMEMHIIPQNAIFEIAGQNNCFVCEVQGDTLTEAATMASYTFVFKKG
ncbi:hypothetical protein C4J81_19225 (plasmid) [Deltaproteobacteria bacterium Smac51]|nr:hypothetical protein C4J81_19225 [Deltaproteobacteria bacterium Smac51]